VFDAFSQYGSLGKENPYLNRVFDANQSILKEVLVMSSAAVRQIIFDHFEKDGTFDRLRGESQEKGQEKARRETALKMLRKGYAPDEVADNVEMPIEWVQSLKK